MHLQEKLEVLERKLTQEFGNSVIRCDMIESVPTVFLTQDPVPEMPGKIGGMDINYQNVGRWEP